MAAREVERPTVCRAALRRKEKAGLVGMRGTRRANQHDVVVSDYARADGRAATPAMGWEVVSCHAMPHSVVCL
jgi:hypothetical protein